MKNKVLRLAIVAVLVVAMVLSMAACNDPKPVVTETPTPSVTPAPTKTPDKTPAPTATPVVPSAADDSALAKATYGIELKAQDFTYGVIANKDDPDERYSDVIVEFNKDLLQNYNALTAAGNVKWSVSYEGEAKDLKAAAYDIGTLPDAAGKARPALTFKKTAPAGVYTVTATVTAEDKGFDFGRFGSIKEEKVVYELTTIVTIKKADLTIKTPSFVAPVEVVETAKAPVATVFELLVADGDDVIGTEDDAWYDKCVDAKEALYANLVKAYGAEYTYFLRAGSMIDTTKVGSYELLVSAHKNTIDAASKAKEENIIPFAELPTVNHNVTFENGKQYFVDAYDWNAVRDAATSILDILRVKGDQLNKIKLARARYDALTDAQKAFFTTGSVALTDAGAAAYSNPCTKGVFMGTGATATKVEIEIVIADLVTAHLVKDANVTVVPGSAIYKLLTNSEKAAKQADVVKAWEKAVKDAKFLDFAGKETTNIFNINNASAVASYNVVKTYYDALSDAEKDILYWVTGSFKNATNATDDKDHFICTKASHNKKDTEGVPVYPYDHDDTKYPHTNNEKDEDDKPAPEKFVSEYDKFMAVTGMFDAKAAQEVKTLIAAAAAAYNRAVVNNAGKYIYEDKLLALDDANKIKLGDTVYGGVVYYLNNAEVVAVTNQAKAAFDKLTKAQKALLKTLVVDDANQTNVAANFDVDARTYSGVLTALKTMNEVVGYMEQVINHTKIEDLQHKADKTPAYASLNLIVYGVDGANNGYLASMAQSANKTDRRDFNAVSDIMKAYATDSASLDAVVAEYKAMIDYILAAEAYKAEQIAALNAMIATEFVAENHTDAEIAVATASTNPVLKALVLTITNEKDPKITAKAGTKSYDGTSFAGIVKKTVQEVLCSNVESYEEAKAAFEGLYNIDKAMSVFTVIYKNTEATSAELGKGDGMFFFTFA